MLSPVQSSVFGQLPPGYQQSFTPLQIQNPALYPSSIPMKNQGYQN